MMTTTMNKDKQEFWEALQTPAEKDRGCNNCKHGLDTEVFRSSCWRSHKIGSTEECVIVEGGRIVYPFWEWGKPGE